MWKRPEQCLDVLAVVALQKRRSAPARLVRDDGEEAFVERTGEKRGSLLDVSFAKQWEARCDEAQKKMAEYFGVSVEYLRGESNDPTTMDNWLSGNVPEDEPEVVIQPKKTIVASAESSNSDTAPLTAMLRSEAFRAIVRETVVEVLKSTEGQKMIANAVKSEMRKL